MRNMFGYGTDKIKTELKAGNRTKAKMILKQVIRNFPLIKKSLGINNEIEDLELLAKKISGMDSKALLEMAVKACEPYLVPENSILKFSYPPEKQQDFLAINRLKHRFITDESVTELITEWDEKDRCFYFYPGNYCPDDEFKQSVRIWLLMSALYSGSLKIGESFENIMRPLNLDDDTCKRIKEYFHSKYYNNKGKLAKKSANFFYNGQTAFVDSFYDIMVANGFLNPGLKANGTIVSRNTKNEQQKYTDRLPDNVTPSFSWNSARTKCAIGYDYCGLDFQLITQYLIERKTASNFAQHKQELCVFSEDLGKFFPVIDKELPESLQRALALYPLSHLRTKLLEPLININNSSRCSAPSREEWDKLADVLNYQTTVYFPLSDTLFHLFLKIRYRNFGERNVLTDQLRNLYETLIFQKNNKNVVRVAYGEVQTVKLEIKLTDGSVFAVALNRRIPERDDIRTEDNLLNPVVIKNGGTRSFASCLEDAFGKDCGIIKEIPEQIFADYIKAVFGKCDGFIYDSSFESVCATCREEIFKDFKNINRISSHCFEKFIYNICDHFQKYEYEYLFHYNMETGFTPIFGLQRKKLYGITADELERELGCIFARFQTDFFVFDEKSRNYKEYAKMIANAKRTLKTIKSLIDRNWQQLYRLCSYLKDLAKIKDYHLPVESITEKTVYSAIRDMEFNTDQNYYDTIIKATENITKMINEFDSYPNNDKYRDSLKDYKSTLEKNDYKYDLKASILSSFDKVMDFLSDNDEDSSNERHNIRLSLDSMKTQYQEIRKIFKDSMNFDISNLSAGRQQFYAEMSNLLQNYEGNKKDIVNKFMIFNTHDPVQLTKAIDYYNHLNSKVLKSLHDFNSVISNLENNPKMAKDYKQKDNYKEYLSQFHNL